MNRLLERFLRAPAPRQILLVDVNPLQAIHPNRADWESAKARERLGLHWCAHPDARPSRARLAQLHAEALAENAERDRIAAAHTQHRKVLHLKGQ